MSLDSKYAGYERNDDEEERPDVQPRGCVLPCKHHENATQKVCDY
jgi:hypothetical protein